MDAQQAAERMSDLVMADCDETSTNYCRCDANYCNLYFKDGPICKHCALKISPEQRRRQIGFASSQGSEHG